MHTYRLSTSSDTDGYHCDLASVRAAIRQLHSSQRIEARVYLIDVSIAKADIVAILNGQAHAANTLRQWRLSQRGALIEIPADSTD